MTNLISDTYRELNSELHSKNPLFGSKAYKQAVNVVESLGLKEGDTLVDYGCGKGSLSKELKKSGVRTINYDPSIGMFSKHPRDYEGYPFQYLACMDVLEHVEPEYLGNVLNDILGCFTDKAFILVSTEPSNKKLSDGRNAHLIINGANWWLDRLEETGYRVGALVDNRKGWLGVVCTKDPV